MNDAGNGEGGRGLRKLDTVTSGCKIFVACPDDRIEHGFVQQEVAHPL